MSWSFLCWLLVRRRVKTIFAIGQLAPGQLDEWNAIVGLRNRIIHEYMNLAIKRALMLVNEAKYRFVTAFLLAPIT